MEYVRQVGKVLVWGGYDVADMMWWWDPVDGTWTEGSLDGGPVYVPNNGPGEAAVHTPTGTVLVFNGETGPDDPVPAPVTWLYDPVAHTWESLHFPTGEGPQLGVGHMLAYHEAADVFVLFGGFSRETESLLTDTWHFDLNSRTWSKQTTTDTPAGRNYVAFAYHPRVERVVMYGSPEFVYDFRAYLYDPDAANWQQAASGPEGYFPDHYVRMVYDHDSDKLVRFGGRTQHAGQVWVYDPEMDAWSELETEGPAPSARSRHAMTSVPGVGVVVFGGTTGELEPWYRVNELWVLDVEARRWERR